MKLTIDIPSVILAIPAGSRSRKVIWSRRQTTLDIPEYSSTDIVRALEYRQDQGAATSTVYRIDDAHFRRIERRPTVGYRTTNDPVGMPAVIRNIAIEAAVEWVGANTPEDMKPFPENAWRSSVAGLFTRLPMANDVAYKERDDALLNDYENLMSEVVGGLAIIDGVLQERCAEPSYAVKGLGDVITVQVQTDRLPERYTNTLAIFPIGKHDEAVGFARQVADVRRITYGETTADMRDCGVCLVDDTTERSLVIAARAAAERFYSEFAADYSPKSKAVSLINDVSVEDITVYRNLRDSTQAYVIGDYFNPDELCLTLRQATVGKSASIFTDANRYPIEMVTDLWEDRPISVLSAAPTP